jgi:hypothetical protein
LHEFGSGHICWAHAVPASRIVVTHARSLILICFPPSVCRSVDARQRRARAPVHLSPVGAPRAAHLVLLAPTCHRCASRRTSSAKDHAPTDAAPRRRRSDPEIRVASAVAARGRTGNVAALNLHLLFLLRWATSTARFPDARPGSVRSKCHAHGCCSYPLKEKGISGQIRSGWLHSRTGVARAHSVTFRRGCRRAGLRSCGRAGATLTSVGLQRSPRAPSAPGR